MCRSDHRAIFACQKYRQAIRHHDGASQHSLRRHAGIRLLTIRAASFKPHDLAAMNLIKKHRPDAACPLQQGTIDANAFGHIAYMGAKVHAVIGHTRYATRAGGENRIDALGRGPVRNQPVGVQNNQPSDFVVRAS